jgi:7-carboxy-7-deazaguanine synthase
VLPSLLVSEVFGPTIQGEGPSTGRRCVFVRLGACNLSCSWCDTPYTWAHSDRRAAMHQSGIKYDAKKELSRITPEKVAEDVLNRVEGVPALLVISGGEPLLQEKLVTELVYRVSGWRIPRIEIETAGTIEPQELTGGDFVRYNVSPKLTHSGNPAELRYKPDVLSWFSSRTDCAFKFVVRADHMDEDFAEIARMANAVSIPHTRIWIMPEGTTPAKISYGMRKLADPVIERGWNLTTRLHTLLWGDERGR